MILPVADDGARPVGQQGVCMYCLAPLGEHKDDCVLLLRSVVLKMTVEYIVQVPRSWDQHGIEFHRNDGSWCADNEIEALSNWVGEQPNPGPCTCNAATFEFVREATQEDHEGMIDLCKPEI